jgi:signal transduction histidine kinase
LNLVDESIANVRELAQLLRPVILDDFGLDASLRWLAEKFAQRTRLEVKVDARCPGRFADETETHLFRIAQEALTNIARHAEAQSVTIQLLREGNMIRLSIRDDGKGLPQENSESPSSLGMVGMRARARQCGGELTVSSIEPHGVCVELSVPARSSQEHMS